MLISIIIGSIIFYGLSCYYAREYLKIAYSENGIWSISKPDILDMFIVFCPGINIIFLIMYFSGSMYKNKNQSGFINNFFDLD